MYNRCACVFISINLKKVSILITNYISAFLLQSKFKNLLICIRFIFYNITEYKFFLVQTRNVVSVLTYDWNGSIWCVAAPFAFLRHHSFTLIRADQVNIHIQTYKFIYLYGAHHPQLLSKHLCRNFYA